MEDNQANRLHGAATALHAVATGPTAPHQRGRALAARARDAAAGLPVEMHPAELLALVEAAVADLTDQA